MGNKRLQAMALLLGGLVFVSGCSGTPQTASGKGAEHRVESAGYESPEDALQAYLEFMKESDISGMISTYAVESYVEKFDFERQLKRLRIYHAMQGVKIPNVNDFAVNINIERRKNLIVESILNQSLVIADFDYDITAPVQLREDSDVDKFMEDYWEALEDIDFSSIEMLGTIEPGELEELYDSAQNRKNINELTKVIGADEMESVVVVFQIANQKYLLCCDAAKYGDRWYLVNPGGNVGILLGINSWSSGMVPLTRTEFRELEGLMVLGGE